MWILDHKEGCVPNNWCFQIVVLEKTLESPLDSKEIKSVNLKGNQSWIFIGRTDAEAEALILWPPDAKSWLTGKDSDAGKDWRQKWRGRQRMRCLDGITNSMTWICTVSGRQWRMEARWDAVHGGRKELDMTEWLKNSNNFPWGDGAGCHDLIFFFNI